MVKNWNDELLAFTNLKTSWLDGKIINNVNIYLFETAHKVVTDWGSRQVCRAGTASNIEKVIRAQHGVVFLRVARRGQNSIHWYGDLDNKAQGKDTLYSDLQTAVLGYAWFLFLFFVFCGGFVFVFVFRPSGAHFHVSLRFSLGF